MLVVHLPVDHRRAACLPGTTALRHAPQARSRGPEGAERSELALDGAEGAWHPLLPQPALATIASPESEKIRQSEEAVRSLSATVTLLEGAVADKDKTIAGLQAGLRKAGTVPLDQPTATRLERSAGNDRRRATGVHTSKRSRLSLAAVGLTMVAIGAVAAALGWLKRAHEGAHGERSPEASVTAITSNAATPTPAAPLVRPDGGSPPANDEPPVPGPAPPDCPTETVLFERSVFKLLPPSDRPRWKGLRRTAAEVEAGAFCLDRRPVLQSEYQACVDEGVCRSLAAVPRAECDTSTPIPEARCVTWEEALTYCRWRWPGGTLPSIEQWEAAARVPSSYAGIEEPSLRKQQALVSEWVVDLYPPAVFRNPTLATQPASMRMTRRRPERSWAGNRPRNAWDRADGAKRMTILHFRCAQPATRPPANVTAR